MLKRSSPCQILHITQLHSTGLSNREIGKKIDLHHRTVGYHLKKNGLNPNGVIGKKLELVGENEAKCSRCEGIFSLQDWPMAREGKKYPYRLSYCNACRKKQMYKRLNDSPKSFMGDRFNKIRLRAIKEGTEFTLTKEHLIDLYDLQEGKCFYSDIKLTLMTGKGRLPTGISIDRVDNSKGYTNENIVLCTSRFNTIKSNLTMQEIEKYMPRIYKRIEIWRRRGIFVFDCNQTGRDF